MLELLVIQRNDPSSLVTFQTSLRTAKKGNIFEQKRNKKWRNGLHVLKLNEYRENKVDSFSINLSPFFQREHIFDSSSRDEATEMLKQW